MRGHRGTETEFKLTTIERLEQQGYTWLPGEEVDREDEAEVVLRARLRAFLAGRYPDLPPVTLDEAAPKLSRPNGVDTIHRNLTFHQHLTRGLERKVQLPDGRSKYQHLYPVDWENPEANDFLVVNQLPIQGSAGRRPDLVVYVNGLPLVVFELKNPFNPKPTVAEAHNQLQHYIAAIPQLFDFNAFCVASDGRTTLHGTWNAGLKWYAPWNSIDGQKPEPSTVRTMKVLVSGALTQGQAPRLCSRLHRLRDRQRQGDEEGRQVPPVLRRTARGREGPPGHALRRGPAYRRDLAHHGLRQVSLHGVPRRHPPPDARAGQPESHPGRP